MASAESFPGDEDFTALFEVEAPYFDPEEVADTIIWPVVDELWQGDWRSESYPGMPFQFPRRSIVGELVTDVYLVAASEHPEEDQEAEGMVCCATIDIQTIVTDALRDHVIGRAFEEWIETRHEYGELYTPEDLVVKTSTAYIFQSGEVLVQNSQHVVEEIDGDILWTSNDYDADVMPFQARLYEHDLNRLGQALFVLTESPEHEEVLAAIKKRPVKPEQPSGEED